MHVRRKRRALLVLCMGWCSTILTFLYVSHSWPTQISSNTLGHNLTLACNINQVNLYYSNFIRYAMTLNFGEYPICTGNLGPPVPESLKPKSRLTTIWVFRGSWPASYKNRFMRCMFAMTSGMSLSAPRTSVSCWCNAEQSQTIARDKHLTIITKVYFHQRPWKTLFTLTPLTPKSAVRGPYRLRHPICTASNFA
jgi:hypothetical protein